MHHRTVEEVMTREVVSVRPTTTFKEIVELFTRNDITAVPVLDPRDNPVGLVSEADLIRKEAVRPDPEGHGGPLWMRPRDRARAEAVTAGEIMTSPVRTARPGWTLVETAREMDQHKVKRLPVVDEAGQLIGIVSRCDLLSVFLREDSAIAQEINHEVLEQTMRLIPGAVRATVHQGVVSLRGQVDRKTMVPVLERLCRSVDGVVSVDGYLDYIFDDTHPGARPAAAGRNTGQTLLR
ncbi:CBS domain-containing protein [Kitasatospora sp. NPDC053057]|uniref:CBS domain-containing protein n=1 Tax=Kitasatospora sp. NPDC053057 TaxID=3364062 RepID=UPI0037CB5D60